MLLLDMTKFEAICDVYSKDGNHWILLERRYYRQMTIVRVVY